MEVRRHYIVALVVVALVSAIGFGAISRGTAELRKQARAIEVASRQTLLASFVLTFSRVVGERDARARAEVRDAVVRLVVDRRRLSSGDRSFNPPDWPPPEVRALDEGSDGATSLTLAFSRAATALASREPRIARATARARLGAVAARLIPLDGRIVAAYDRASDRRRIGVTIEEVLTFATLAFVLLFEALVVFRPMQRELERQRARLLAQVAALGRSESQLARAQRNARAGSWELELATGFVVCSPQMYAILGIESGEPLHDGAALRDFCHPSDLGALRSAMRRSLCKRTPFAIDLRIVRADGQTCWVQQHGEYLYDAGGRAVHFFGTAIDVTARKVAEENLAYRALHDPLTDLPNRTLLVDRIESALARATRGETLGAIAFVDLDHFKRVNDTFGHTAGDVLLCEVAARLRRSLRATDTVARSGGDEFVLVFERVAGPDDVRRLVENVGAALREPCSIGGGVVRASASIGVALFGDDDATADDLLRDADTAMYRAKTSGGDAVAFFDAAMRAETIERLTLENDVRFALERSEFVIAYQPIVDATDGRATSFEALVRWAHPAFGTIAPARFIEMIEENGLIVEVGAWVLREACARTRGWHDLGYTDLAVSVNVSARQLQDARFVEGIASVLADTGLAPQYLELELTESSLVRDVASAVAIVKALKALGVRVAIDDFGTGYSSIAYLKHFDVDTVKIDRIFVNDLGDETGSAIVHAIATLAHNLGSRVVAEGVETFEQAAALRALDCDGFQGYLYSRPIVSEDLTPETIGYLVRGVRPARQLALVTG